jgi:hypothetical protein
MTWRNESQRHKLAFYGILTKNQILYRGAETPELKFRCFDGIWLAKSKEIADQYGNVHVFN